MPSKLPLEGIKVADFSTQVVGPLTTKYLADCGAEVIKVESMYALDLIRVTIPFKDGIVHPDRSYGFPRLHTDKYGVSLDLKHPKGPEIAKRLAAWADVVIESFTPGVMKRRGLDYEEIKKVKPDIIMLSTSNQGQTGRYGTHPGWGFQTLALAGFTHFTGWADREPVGIPSAYTDYLAPQFAVIAILAAINYKRRTGKGQYIDLSQLEVGLLFLATALLDYSSNSIEQTRCGNLSSYAVPHNAYCCKGEDRWCAIAVTNKNEWKTFCQILGEPEWSKDDKFSTPLNRKRNEAELDRLVEGCTLNFTAEEVMVLMQSKGVAAGVVKSNKDMWTDPQLRHRDHWPLAPPHPVLGSLRCPLPPYKLSKTPAGIRMPGPCLGQHNEYIYSDVLGFSNEEFVKLLNEGVFK
ncbi:MAG: CoA transferase [Chloroflexota bacterium]|nr:CoA transferase [Chloroflexota bacterium]